MIMANVTLLGTNIDMSFVYCNHNVHSTIEHQIWSCPHISPLWDLVLNSLTQANIPHSIHSFSDLFLYIEKGNLRDLTLIIRDQIIYNTIYTMDRI